MNGLIKIVTIIFLAAAFFGLLLHPQLLSSSLSGTTSLVRQVQQG